MTVTPRKGLYLVSRTSAYGDKPCDEAFKLDIVGCEEWAIEVSDIQDFVDRYGNCIVGRDSNGFCTVEIYDDYRE